MRIGHVARERADDATDGAMDLIVRRALGQPAGARIVVGDAATETGLLGLAEEYRRRHRGGGIDRLIA